VGKVIKMLVLVFIGSILVGISAASINPETIAAIWLFDEGSGDTAKDSSGNNNNGTILGPEWVGGKIGTALEFDGTDDYVDCGNDLSLDLIDQITFVVWTKHPAGTEGYIIIKNTPNDDTRQYGFLDYISNNSISFFCHIDTGSREELQWDGEMIDDNTWHHVAITVNNPEVELFIDGASKGIKTLGGNLVNTDASVWIGKRKPGNFPYTGLLDELAIFNVVLSKDDINLIMNDGLVKAVLAVFPAGKLATAWAAVKNQR